MNVVMSAQQQASRDWTDNVGTWFVVVAVIALAMFIAYINFQNGRAFRIESSTSLPPGEALDALQTQMANDGWNLGYRDSTSLVMNIQNGASLGSAAALGCFSIWLALLYFISVRGPVVVKVETTATGSGTVLITNGSKSGRYLEYMAYHLRELPKQ